MFNETKAKFINSLVDSADFILLQEHWLHNSTLNVLDTIRPGILYVASSAMCENIPLVGRPHGGCAILWKSNFSHKVEKIECRSDRLCAIKVHVTAMLHIVIFNVYMQCDAGSINIDLYTDILNEADTIVNNVTPNEYIIMGDFNTDFRRTIVQTQTLMDYIKRENLVCLDLDNVTNVKDTFFSSDGRYSSCIITSPNLSEYISGYKVIDSVDNMSDHAPISCEFHLEVTYYNKNGKVSMKRTLWEKATGSDIENYKNVLSLELSQIDISKVVTCKDKLCCQSSHRQMITELFEKIVNVCILSAERTIPSNVNKGKGRPIPGLSE